MRDIGYENIGFTGYLSLKSALTKHTDEDKLVEISANGTVILGVDGHNFIGVVRIIDDKDKLASVQIDGIVTLLYDTDHAPTVTDGNGWQALTVGNATNKVMAATEAVGVPLRKVFAVDTVNHTVTFQL